ncbi:hypothetical protein A5N15_04480 [Rothia kristinae]|uniref:Uncharacterized protein n=1 Tax=Rothia kristinae TaxID=37923 RepID=A0A657IV39_9MICC|nr:hypothetical protein A5N15_04480 [Rothia kristinae]
MQLVGGDDAGFGGLQQHVQLGGHQGGHPPRVGHALDGARKSPAVNPVPGARDAVVRGGPASMERAITWAPAT